LDIIENLGEKGDHCGRSVIFNGSFKENEERLLHFYCESVRKYAARFFENDLSPGVDDSNPFSKMALSIASISIEKGCIHDRT